MSVYHWLVVLVMVLALLMHGERKRNVKYILIITVLMFGVCGLRDAYTIGADSASSYLHEFERMKDEKWEDLPGFSDWLMGEQNNSEERTGHGRSFGLSWLMKIVYDWTEGNYQWVVSVIAAFVMLSVAQLVYRFSSNPLQSFLYFFGLMIYVLHFSILKQSAAMGFVLLSFNAIIDRKPFWFVLLVSVASIFHFPALVFLPAYWIANINIEKGYLFLLAVLFLLTYAFRDQLLGWMTDTYETAVYEYEGVSFLANKVIVMLVIIVAALVIRPPSVEDRIYCALLQIIGVAAVIQTFSSYNNTFERLADYYFQFAIVFIPMVFENVKTKRAHMSQRELKIVRQIGPYVFCAFAIWRFLNGVTNNPTLFPHQFYFQAEKAEETLALWLSLL